MRGIMDRAMISFCIMQIAMPPSKIQNSYCFLQNTNNIF